MKTTKNTNTQKATNIANFESITAYQTDKYDLFFPLLFNREVCDAHVKLIEESMKKWGFTSIINVIKTSVIDGVPRYYILDGQHRLSAARRLNIPFKFQIKELGTQKELVQFIADLNTSSKGWGTSQFLKIWGGLNIPEYLKLKDVFDKTGFQISPLIEAYTFSGEMTAFRKGTLVFPNEAQSDKLIEQLTDLNQYLPSKAFIRRSIVRLMRHEKYNHVKMLKAVKFYTQSIGAFPENEKEVQRIFLNLIENNN